MPTPPDWLATASPPAGGTELWKVALRRRSGWLHSSPRQFGPTTRTSWARASVARSCWIRAPSSPSSPNPDDTTTAARTPAATASRNTSRTRPAGTQMTTMSRSPGTSSREAYVGTPGQVVGPRVDGDHTAMEAGLDDRAEHGRPDPGAVGAGADHGDRGGPEHRLQRPGLGAELPGVRAFGRHLGGAGAERQHHGADVEGALAGVAGGREHGQHRVVLGEHVGLQRRDSESQGARRQVLEQQGADALAASVVGDEEGHLVAGRGHRLRRGEPDQPAVPLGDQSQRLRIGEHVVDVRVGGMPGHAEEPHPDRLVGHLLVQLVQRGAVTGPQRPDHGDGPVGQQHVGGSRDFDDGRHGHTPSLRWAGGRTGGSLVPVAKDARPWEPRTDGTTLLP